MSEKAPGAESKPMTVTKEDLGDLTFGEYRKKGLTPISDTLVPVGTVVFTSETEDTTVEEPSRIALDGEGHPYPIREAIFQAGFEVHRPEEPGAGAQVQVTLSRQDAEAAFEGLSAFAGQNATPFVEPACEAFEAALGKG